MLVIGVIKIINMFKLYETYDLDNTLFKIYNCIAPLLNIYIYYVNI